MKRRLTADCLVTVRYLDYNLTHRLVIPASEIPRLPSHVRGSGADFRVLSDQEIPSRSSLVAGAQLSLTFILS